MSKLLGPYTLSATSTASFDIEWDQVAQPPIGIDLENISGLLLEVDIAGQPYWLSPWTAKYFDVPTSSIKVTIQPHGDISPTGNSDPLLMVADLFQQGDTPPVIRERSLAGLATIAAITPQSKAIGTLNLGSSAGSIAIPDWAKSIEMWADNPSNYYADGLTITGATSGFVYFDADHGESGSYLRNPIKFDVDGAIDSVLDMSITTPVAITLYLVASGSYSGINNVATPLIVSETDPHPRYSTGQYNVSNLAAGSTATLVPAPNAGMIWEIDLLHAHANTSTASATNYLQFSTGNGGTPFRWSEQLATGTTLDLVGPFYLNDSVVLRNSLATGNVAYGGAVVRQVPLA